MEPIGGSVTRATSTDTAKLDTVELPNGAVVHYSGLEGSVSFVCGQERNKGDWWSQYQDHVNCAKCKAWIKERSA